jgi:hypothetical protein
LSAVPPVGFSPILKTFGRAQGHLALYEEHVAGDDGLLAFPVDYLVVVGRKTKSGARV